MPENQLRHIDFVLFVHLDRDSLPIVEHRYETLILADFHLQQIHPLISLVIISRIDKDFIKHLVKSRHICHFTILKLSCFFGEDPFVGFLHLDAPHVGIRAEEDVLEGCLLLECLLDCLHANYLLI